jgi:hypothetical protein
MKKLRSYGFLVEETKFGDCPAVVARVLAREGDCEYPINARTEGEDSIWGAPKAMDGCALYGLEIILWRGDNYFTAPQVRFDNARFIDTRLAERLLKTMKRIDRQIAKSDAREAGDVLMAVAKAIGATWSVSQRGNSSRGFYSDMQWSFGDVTEARDRLRELVEKIRPTVAA